MGNYEINQGYVVLDENMEVVDWIAKSTKRYVRSWNC